MLMYAIPLLKVEATNPPKSVMTPPPILMSRLFLSPFKSDKVFQTPIQVSIVLFISPDSISIISIAEVVSNCSSKIGKHNS